MADSSGDGLFIAAHPTARAVDCRAVRPTLARAMTDEHGPGPRTRAYVAWTLKHGWLLWAIALALAIPATWRTVWLYGHLKSELEELLPRESPSVRALDELRARLPGMQYLVVVVDTATPEGVPAGE